MARHIDPQYIDRELHEAASRIAAHMGWDWSYSLDESYERSAAIVGPEGMIVTISSATGISYDPDGRLEVCGRYPEVTLDHYHREVFDPRPEERPRITVAAGRAPHEVARDVLRRFLPLYAPLFRKGLERKEAFLEAYDRREAALERISRILGAHRPADSRDRREEVSLPGSIYGRIRVCYHGDEASIDVSNVPIETACRIAELLKECC